MRNAELDAFTQAVRDRSDITEVVGAYVKLTRKGNRLWGCCPFHAEKTPSFAVTPERGMFYCFGCHVGGDVFKFISLIENISFWEAIKLQARRLSIPLPQRKLSPEQAVRDKERRDLFAANELAKKFFHNCLTATKFGARGRAYWKRRELNEAAWDKFSLGVAPDAWDKLTRAFIKRGIPQETLVKAGLSSAREDKPLIDRFRNRAMIPIFDELGQTVGFGGRVMGEGEPKYLNTAETPIFNKRRLLYGLNRAKNFIRREGKVIVVEGYMDAISLANAGIENTVATLGTAFTAEHLKLLLRYGGEIFFCYDSDEAGQKATVRALSVLKDANVTAKVIVVPDGKDPDEYVKKHGAAAFAALLPKAANVLKYRLDYILSHNDYTTLTGKLQTVNEALPVLATTSHEATRNEYTQILARKLLIDEASIRSELANFMRHAGQTATVVQVAQRPVQKKRDNALLNAERIVIRTMLRDDAMIDFVLTMLPDGLPSRTGREITDFLRRGNSTNTEILSEEAAAELSRSLAEDNGENKNAVFTDAINTLRRAYLEGVYQKIGQKAENCYKNGDNTGYDEAMKELDEINKQIREVS